MVCRAPYPRFERGAGKPQGFSGTEDWPHVLEHQHGITVKGITCSGGLLRYRL
jgi:hypothetical protein